MKNLKIHSSFSILFPEKKILSGHDVSDGGLITCLLEMSFAGISGIKVNISHKLGSPVSILFAEEVGWVLEVDNKDVQYVLEKFKTLEVPAFLIGKSTGFGLTSELSLQYLYLL